MPTTKYKTPISELAHRPLQGEPDWKVVVEDSYGNSYTGYGDTYEAVWEQVADVENFDIPSTVCSIFQLRPKECRFGQIKYEWDEDVVMYGDEDEALIEQMTMYNFDPKEVL